MYESLAVDSRLELGWASGMAQDRAPARDGLAGRAGRAGQEPRPAPREGWAGCARGGEAKVRGAQPWLSRRRPEGTRKAGRSPSSVPPFGQTVSEGKGV